MSFSPPTAPSRSGPPTASPKASGGGADIRRLWVLMATVFVDMVGAMIVLPLLPFYVLKFHGQPSFVGILVSVFFIAQMLVSPLWGRLSDRYGRRPLILAGLFISAVAFAMFGLATSLTMLLLMRVVQGAASGTVGVVQAYVSDAIAPEERAMALGWVSAATSAGVGIGALIGTAATYFGQAAPGYLAAGLCLVNLVSAWRWLPESQRRDGSPAGAAGPRASVWARLWDVLRDPASPVGSLIWIYALGMMIQMAMTSVLGLYLQHTYKVTEHSIGPFYAFISVISVVMRALLLGPVVRRMGEVGAMRLGTLTLAVGMGAMPLAAWLPVSMVMRIAAFAAVVMLVPVGTALLFPATTALVSRRCRRDETGQVMGVQQLFGGIGRVMGPLWSAWLFGWSVNLPFWISALLMLVGGFLTLRVQPEPRRPEAEEDEVAAAAPPPGSQLAGAAAPPR